ncbi:hypothetical protein HY643_03995 [Candidatus Woesearchaeota archaeon]|nr:hypothetical protein [Candidatus Woesearchaeota archaeon]
MIDATLSLLGGKSIFTDKQLLWIFFFYGLGFLILSAVTFIKKCKICADVDLTRSFYFLGAFGLTHGITEWIDLSRLWVDLSSGTTIPLLDEMKVFFLTISFIFLMQFAINILTLRRERYTSLRWLPLAALIIFFIVTLVTGTFMDSELIVRYAFGFSGALLTSIAFMEIRKVALGWGLNSLIRGSTLMAIAFGVYAFFGGGLITFVVLGIPPQLVRMLCALLAAYASFDILTVLEIGLKNNKETSEMVRKQKRAEKS